MSSNCKDFFVFRVNWSSKRQSTSIMMRNAQRFNEFYWKFIKIITNTPEEVWFDKYMFGTKDCVNEELHEFYGIRIFLLRSSNEHFYIPLKNHFEIIKKTKKLLKEVDLPYKIFKRARIDFPAFDKVLTHNRENSIFFTNKSKERMFMAEHTRKLLFEKQYTFQRKKI